MLAGCATSYRSTVEALRPAPAHWIDTTDTFAPSTLWGHFSFNALSFPTASEGWIVGDHFVLHLVRDDLSMTFLRPTSSWLDSVDFRTPDEGWAAGLRHAGGVMWHYVNGRWEPSEMPLAWEDWQASGVWASLQGTWAEVAVAQQEDVRPGLPKRRRSVLLHSDDGGWQVDDSIRMDEHGWVFVDACFHPTGEGWFVGSEKDERGVIRALAVRRVDGEWRRISLPEFGGWAGLKDVVCVPGNRAVALGHTGNDRNDPGHPVLLRHDGERWERIELPEAFRRAAVGAVAALSDSDVWLAVSNVVAREDDRATFLHWSAGQWTEVAAPSLPGGRAIAYFFSAMQFVSPTEGWAIANVYKGRGMARGLIFHYRDGVWRNRNWSWHFWNEPWFGFSGY